MRRKAFIAATILALFCARGIEFAMHRATGEARAAGPGSRSGTRKLPPLPDDCWGVYSWCSWNPSKITRRKCPDLVGAPIIMHWKSLEPKDGDYRFKELLGERLRLAKQNRFYVFAMIWVGPFAPKWIYDAGVPRVATDRAGWTFPHYFDEDYVRYFHRLIRKFGEYVDGLPPDLRRLILFVQCAEGSTGDGNAYKGRPKEAKYNISRDEWGRFRIRTWELFREVFQEGKGPPIRLVVNNDANRAEQHEWLLRNQDEIGCKQGMFSHGYHISWGTRRLDAWREFVAKVERAGKAVFTRGEMDAEFQRSGWSRKNPKQALYWSGLYALHCGLDLWNMPGDACQGDTYASAIRFFNKYAGKRDATTSPAAFCALRRGLDASDTKAFPEKTYGRANWRSADRYVKITKAFARYGAYQGDPEKALGGGMRNRQRKDYNDAGWGILPGNYWRFLEQIEPDATSVGWWHVPPKEHHFSRFARGFEHRTGRRTMYFRLDNRFFADRAKPGPVRVRVVYLDKGDGKWALGYGTRRGAKVAFDVGCRDTGLWQEKSVMLKDAVFARALPKGADLILESSGGGDTIFHMIELDREQALGKSTPPRRRAR